MKYYSEVDTKDLRVALEKEILSWSQVGTKKMFGCPCYQVRGKLFVFLVTNGIVITHLEQTDRERLSRKHKTTFFQAGKKTVKKWIKISASSKDLDLIMPYVRKSYESALKNKRQ